MHGIQATKSTLVWIAIDTLPPGEYQDGVVPLVQGKVMEPFDESVSRSTVVRVIKTWNDLQTPKLKIFG